MSIFKKFYITLYTIICILALTLTGITGYYNFSIDENYSISKGSHFVINSLMPVTAEYNGREVNDCAELSEIGANLRVDLKLFGVIPVKQTNIKVVSKTNVAVLGIPFGIKMYTEGVLVTEISNVKSNSTNCCPANEAGIKKGDYVISVNEIKITSNEDLAHIIEDSLGQKLEFKILRDGKYLTLKLTPVLSDEDNLFKAGIWVKDSSAGIGTLTFYSPQCNTVCGLGHAVYDKDTGNILKFSKGELVGANIIYVNKAVSGVPGELKGKLNYNSIANMKLNNHNGVYGDLKCQINTENMTEIAHKSEIKSGKAEILCTIDESGVQSFACEIKVKDQRVNDTVQNLTVVITDEALINKTGGIVQGMSGSPIIQNGKLIGAVTHVLVDDPTKGYGIFAENMLTTAQSVANEQLKEAS